MMNVRRLIQQRAISAFLNERFTLPVVTFPTLQAPSRTKNYMKVGQAFDYLLRFYIERENGFCDERWTANAARAVSVPLREDTIEEYEAYEEKKQACLPFLEKARQVHSTYLSSGIVTDDVFKACLDLSSLDRVAREGELPDDVGIYDAGDITDLRQLYTIIPQGTFQASDILLNPAIKTGRTEVIGDTDLFLDNKLIDIKTTIRSMVERQVFHQVVVYTLFASKYGIYGREGGMDCTTGIYFSRHGLLALFNVKALCTTKYQKTVTEFMALAKETATIAKTTGA